MALNVLQVLQNKGIFVEAACGGAGTCGKCVVQVDGVQCLACQTLFEGQSVSVDSRSGNEFTVLDATVESAFEMDGQYGMAVDIGTTTIAFALVDLKTGKVAASHGIMNSGRAFGFDVISRIKAADEGKLQELNEYMLRDINKVIMHICKKPDLIQKMAIAANTTMLHILMRADCHSLGQYPFTPVFIDMQRRPFKEIFGCGTLSCEVTLLPGISTYVGADITAGIYSLNRKKSTFLLIDLGTNGEMALVAKDTVTATATAAGPAFEAGNISCGVGSIPGAIYRYDSSGYKTIADKDPVGLCGSGVLDVAAKLVLDGIIDEAGTLDEDFAVAPGITFTQQDVRELQLAKSAVRAGIEIILEDISYNDIDMVYLAGGFGHALNLESAITLGILPQEWRHKVQSVGNSSLTGCIRFLTEKPIGNAAAPFEFISNSKEINLSAHPRFNDLFMEHMMFIAD